MNAGLRVGVLGASGSWHSRGLVNALAERGHDVLSIPATRLRSVVGGDGDAHVLGPDGDALDALDLLIVRGLPRGSLEQVIFRMDALHVLAEQGVRCVNHPRAIERTIDKSWAGAAHWGYKEKASSADVAWLQRIVDWSAESSDPAEFLETLKLDLDTDVRRRRVKTSDRLVVKRSHDHQRTIFLTHPIFSLPASRSPAYRRRRPSCASGTTTR